MKVGVALAGGGLKGVAHIGVLKAFEELGIKIDYLSGTSSGSMAASLYSMGCKPEEIKTIILNSYKSMVKIPKKTLFSAGCTFFIKKQINLEGLSSGDIIENTIQEAAKSKNVNKLEDLKIPTAIATVDTISTKECIFLSTKPKNEKEDIDYLYGVEVGKAVRASMAFPGIFKPFKYDKYNFIDGGTKDNLPISVLKDMGADVSLGFSFKLDDYEVNNQNIFDVILRTVDIFSLKDVRAAQKEADYALEIDASGTSLITIDDIDKVVNIGYDAVMNHKDEILKIVNKK